MCIYSKFLTCCFFTPVRFCFAAITTILSVVSTDPVPSVAAREDTDSSGSSLSVGLSVGLVLVAVIFGLVCLAFLKRRRSKRRRKRAQADDLKQSAKAKPSAVSTASAAAAGDDDDLYSDYDSAISLDDALPSKNLPKLNADQSSPK